MFRNHISENYTEDRIDVIDSSLSLKIDKLTRDSCETAEKINYEEINSNLKEMFPSRLYSQWKEIKNKILIIEKKIILFLEELNIFLYSIANKEVKNDSDFMSSRRKLHDIQNSLERFFTKWSDNKKKNLKNPKDLITKEKITPVIKWTGRAAALASSLLSYYDYSKASSLITVPCIYIEAITSRWEKEIEESKEKWEEFKKDTEELWYIYLNNSGRLKEIFTPLENNNHISQDLRDLLEDLKKEVEKFIAETKGKEETKQESQNTGTADNYKRRLINNDREMTSLEVLDSRFLRPNIPAKPEYYNWENIHPNFTPFLVEYWQDLNFTYQETQDWANACGKYHFNPQEVEFITWLRDIKYLTPEQVLNYGDLAQLKIEYRNQLTAQMEQPAK